MKKTPKIKNEYKRLRTIIHSCKGNVKYYPALLNMIRTFTNNNTHYYGRFFAKKLYKSLKIQFNN